MLHTHEGPCTSMRNVYKFVDAHVEDQDRGQEGVH